MLTVDLRPGQYTKMLSPIKDSETLGYLMGLRWQIPCTYSFWQWGTVNKANVLQGLGMWWAYHCCHGTHERSLGKVQEAKSVYWSARFWLPAVAICCGLRKESHQWPSQHLIPTMCCLILQLLLLPKRVLGHTLQPGKLLWNVRQWIPLEGPATHLFLVLLECRSHEKKPDFAGPPRWLENRVPAVLQHMIRYSWQR